MELRWGEMFQEDKLLRMREKKGPELTGKPRLSTNVHPRLPSAKMLLGAPVTT